MANFLNTDNKRNSARDAANFVDILRAMYQQSKLVQEYLARYQSGTDPVFNAALNSFHDLQERNKLGVAIGLINTMVAGLEADPDLRVALNLPPLP